MGGDQDGWGGSRHLMVLGGLCGRGAGVGVGGCHLKGDDRRSTAPTAKSLIHNGRRVAEQDAASLGATAGMGYGVASLDADDAGMGRWDAGLDVAAAGCIGLARLIIH